MRIMLFQQPLSSLVKINTLMYHDTKTTNMEKCLKLVLRGLHLYIRDND